MCFSLIMVTAAAALDQREFPCHACQLKLWPDLTLSILREGAGRRGWKFQPKTTHNLNPSANMVNIFRSSGVSLSRFPSFTPRISTQTN